MIFPLMSNREDSFLDVVDFKKGHGPCASRILPTATTWGSDVYPIQPD